MEHETPSRSTGMLPFRSLRVWDAHRRTVDTSRLISTGRHMGEVVEIGVAAKQRRAALEAAWDAYIAAIRKSQETLQIEDGIAAGKAYRYFLEVCARSA